MHLPNLHRASNRMKSRGKSIPPSCRPITIDRLFMPRALFKSAFRARFVWLAVRTGHSSKLIFPMCVSSNPSECCRTGSLRQRPVPCLVPPPSVNFRMTSANCLDECWAPKSGVCGAHFGKQVRFWDVLSTERRTRGPTHCRRMQLVLRIGRRLKTRSMHLLRISGRSEDRRATTLVSMPCRDLNERPRPTFSGRSGSLLQKPCSRLPSRVEQ